MTFRDFLRLAALVLFVLAAIGAFFISPWTALTDAGLAYAGLACLTAATTPWTKP